MAIHLVVLLLVCVAVILLLHHGWVHHFEDAPSHAREESCLWACYFQPKDILHYESWSMVCLLCSFSVGLISDLEGVASGDMLSVFAVLLCVMGALLMLIGCMRSDGDGRVLGYQFRHICNHETWIVVCATNALGWGGLT